MIPGPTNPDLYFLKLGGSLITNKTKPHTVRLDVLTRLAGEIASARQQRPGLQLLLGHGSGSFGHVPAKRWGTRQGVHSPQEWVGFLEVWREAAALNRLVLEALGQAGLPCLAFAPSASVLAQGGKLVRWDLAPVRAALEANLLPVVYGDVIFDTEIGGTIFSTEDLFEHLAWQLRPARILLAGLEPGVWADFPDHTLLVAEITPAGVSSLIPSLSGSSAADVTGGMASKVHQSLSIIQDNPDLEIYILSGMEQGNVHRSLLGEQVGTRLHLGSP